MRVSRIVAAGAAGLAACGVLAMAPAAVSASSASIPTWTKQAPAAHPSARFAQAMAYDAATGTVVLFGGAGRHGRLGDTWTWDGTTWTRQHPPVHPSVRSYAVMAYDAATRTVVLFGGAAGRFGGWAGDTWTWDGTTWTQQAPATSPPGYWRRWPMTQPPGPPCCSAVSTTAAPSLTPGRGDDRSPASAGGPTHRTQRARATPGQWDST